MPKVVKPKTGAALAKVAAGDGKKVAPKRKKLYSMPEKIAEGTVLTDMAKSQWRVGPSIGTGGFGEIYSACRVGEKSYDYVVKCEPHGNGPLFVEMHFYMRNARLEDIQRFQREHGLKSLGMPHMIGSGSVDIRGQKHRFLVMPRYGSDIEKYFVANGHRLPEATIYRITLQMLDVYEFIHSCGYVHADLKASNILLGYGKSGGAQAYLLDFGLASHFTTKDFKPDPKKMHNGTIEYTSRDAHHGVATMRGDMEILGYNIIHWFGVQLPWVKSNLLAVPTKVQKAKEDFMNDVSTNLKTQFPKGVPVPISEYIKYVAKMQYNEKPDFNKCRLIFSNALKTMKVSNAGDFEFKMKADNKATAVANEIKHKSPAKRAVHKDTSLEIFASDDDDDDVVFEEKKPVKKAPPKVYKTIAKKKEVHVSPKHKKSPRLMSTPKLSPLANSFSPTVHKTVQSPVRKRRSVSASPVKSRNSPRNINVVSTLRGKPNTENGTPNPSSASKTLRATPLMSKPGKTIVNDNITPKPRATKTYEVNVELDVSLNANVIVNVKRKKKPDAKIGTTATDSVGQGSSKANGHSKRATDNSVGDRTDSPMTRVKVRKVANDDASESPYTPVVTVRKRTARS